MASSKAKLDFNTEWPKVTAGFNTLLSAIETGKGLSVKDWMQHYNSVFQLAIAQHEEKIYVDLAKIFERFVRAQSKKIFEKPTADTMLKEYLRLLSDFLKTSLSVSRICKYLERYWIPSNLTKTVQGIEVRSVYPLGLVMWRQHCFDPVKDKLIPSLLELLDQDRNGNKQDKNLIKQMVTSYIEFDKVGPGEGQQFYEKEFEVRYITNLKNFYARESTAFLQSNGVSAYIQRAEERILEEKANAEFLGTYASISEPKIKKAIDEVLITKHMELIQSDFLGFLREDRNEDMRRVYFLLQRVVDGLPSTAGTFQAYLTEFGTKKVEVQRKKTVKNALDSAIPFVKDMVAFYEKYASLVKNNFSDHTLFKSALDKAFRDIMNQPAGKFNIPRLLNFYLDNIIKGKEKDLSTEEEIDNVLQSLVALFSYLQDKDEFFEYFRKALCKRLLSKGKGYNDNAEKSFLGKLKQESGDNNIRKLQGMFNDVQDETLKEMQQKFDTFNKGSSKVGNIDFEISVLNEAHWPISSTQKFPVVLQNDLDECKKIFETFYNKETEKRKLTWLYNYGTINISGRFTNQKLPITINVTPLQAAILLCFSHEKPVCTFAEILNTVFPSTSTNLKENPFVNILGYAIAPLIYYKHKILSSDKENADKEAVSAQDTYTLLDKIPVAKLPRKITLPGGSASSVQQVDQETDQEVLKAREFEIDAAMVRVMKSRNRLDWNQLQIEVTNILQSRFRADPKVLKKRLESLIDRKFMERDEKDPKMIIYIS